MIGYYDYVLGLIPTALIGITAFLNLVGLSLVVALPLGAGVALALMLHAMFVRSPVADPGHTTTAGSGGTSTPAPGASD